MKQQLLLCFNKHFAFQMYYTQLVSNISSIRVILRVFNISDIRGKTYQEKEAVGRFLIYSAEEACDRFLIYPA